MKFSFIVPTYNEEDYIEECLEDIHQQNCDKEIIVVDGGSHDKTLEIAEEYADKIIEDIEGRGKSRHIGAEKSAGDLLAFIDADTQIKESFSEDVEDFMEHNELVACATKFYMEGFRSKVVQAYGNTVFPRMNPVILPGFNTVVRKSYYEESIGFEDLKNEDIQFSKEIAKYGKTRILNQKLVTTSNRRITEYGLTGTLVYYLWKDMKRRKNNISQRTASSAPTDFIEIFSA